MIRPLLASDETEWRRLWKAYLVFYETERPEAVYESSFKRMLSGEPNEYRGLIAILEGRAVGIAHYLFHRTNWEIGDTCYLQDLYADPDVRGKGIGRALIEAVYKTADAHGAAPVYWTTQDFNAVARQLYDRIGKKTPFIKYVRA